MRDGTLRPTQLLNILACYELGKRLPLRAGGLVLRDHYAALGVRPDADHEVVKAAFRALAKKYHPDTAAHGAAAKGRFREINEAHFVLSNPEARAQYDGWLRAQHGTVAPFVAAVFLSGAREWRASWGDALKFFGHPNTKY